MLQTNNDTNTEIAIVTGITNNLKLNLINVGISYGNFVSKSTSTPENRNIIAEINKSFGDMNGTLVTIRTI